MTTKTRPDLADAVERRDVSIFERSSSPTGKRPPHPDSIRLGLEEAGARRELAEALRSEALIDLRAWVAAAREGGMEVKEIAELAGISRQAVYDWSAD